MVGLRQEFLELTDGNFSCIHPKWWTSIRNFLSNRITSTVKSFLFLVSCGNLRFDQYHLSINSLQLLSTFDTFDHYHFSASGCITIAPCSGATLGWSQQPGQTANVNNPMPTKVGRLLILIFQIIWIQQWEYYQCYCKQYVPVDNNRFWRKNIDDIDWKRSRDEKNEKRILG